MIKHRLEVIENDEPLTPEELDYLIANPPRNGGSMIKTIPPETAKHATDTYNKRNRPARWKQIRTFAEFMADHNWSVNGATIGFTKKGRLSDGQNRLYACQRANVPFRTHIVFGVEDDSFDTIDAGKSRDHADILTLMGAKDPKVMAVAVRWIEWIKTGKGAARKPAFSPQETGELYLKHKDAENFTSEARKIAYGNLQSPGVVAAMLYCFNEVDGDLAADFADAWATGTNVPGFHAITKMQTELTRLRNAGLKGSDAFQTTRAALIINCWNATRRFKQSGRTVGVPIRWDRDKPFPKIQ